MAVKRTGTIFSAKKLQFKHLPALSFFGKILEVIGRPVFWLLLGIGYLILKIIKLLRQTRFPRIRLPKIKFPEIKFPKVVLPLKKLLVLSMVMVFLIILAVGFYFWLIKDLPDPNHLITREPVVSTKIYDRHGQLLYKIYRNQNRTLVNLKEVPLSLIQATIAIEDAEFYQHRGFSFKGIIRALFKNLKGDKLYGGSTITQQLVKNALLSPQRTLKRKIKEMILSLVVERKFTKDEILQMYLNEVGYGGAAYGVEEAAQMYFGKSVQALKLTESTLLAGLPVSPTRFSPFGSQPEKAKERQKLVLRRMTQEGFITAEEEKQTVAQELHFAPQRTDIKAPHFVMYVKEILVKKYGERLVEEGGLEITTSLDLNIQQQVEKIVSQEVNNLTHLRIGNGAALVTLPKTGEVLAMVGSKDYFDLKNDGNVNVTSSLRQPGSAIKPVNYSVALENGFTAATIIPDTPITYRLPGQPPYSPRNYDSRFHGNIPLRVALASSYNVPAVKVLSALGVEKMIQKGREMGITTWEEPSRFGLSLTLGGGEVKMVDLAVVYGALANLGIKVNLKPILAVKSYNQEFLTSNDGSTPQRVLPSNIAYILTDILTDNEARTPAFGPNSILKIANRPHVAVKTGTTQNLRDNWTIGYTPDFLVAVWVGNNDNSPMSYVASGITGASPIWHKITSFLLQDIPNKEFPKPEDLKAVKICSLTGTLPCEGCPTRIEYFLPGTEPKFHCQPQTPTPSE
ncbi:MAG TPA: PBP1A family penicillin-binding protein [Nevskiaceae bacterium]|nr:PBP1A family penicillin-binding protein [Nevskiaceae bacterium]